MSILHNRFHIYIVYTQCGYGYVVSNHHYARIVHHMYHIYMVYPQCGHAKNVLQFTMVNYGKSIVNHSKS